MPKKQPPKQARKKRKPTLLQTLRGHANGVMRALGKGHTERVYHRAMIASLNRARIPHRSEVLAPIYFMGEVVGFGRCDIVIGDLAVELKANVHCPRKASSQLQKYIESAKASSNKRRSRPRGAVVNFSQRTGRPELWLFDRGRRS
jgi:GxxExxY protein